MRIRSVLAGAALGAAVAAAGPALAADMKAGDTTDMSPQLRQMHERMGVDVTDDGSGQPMRQSAERPDLLVGGQQARPGQTTVIITQRQAYPELFAAEVDGIAIIEDGGTAAGSSMSGQ